MAKVQLSRSRILNRIGVESPVQIQCTDKPQTNDDSPSAAFDEAASAAWTAATHFSPCCSTTINGETLQAMNLDDACRYVGYWGTGNGDMRATKELVRQKIIAARDLIKCHPLTPELATELFTSLNPKPRQNGRKMTSFRGAMAKLGAGVDNELGGSAPHQCR